MKFGAALLIVLCASFDTVESQIVSPATTLPSRSSLRVHPLGAVKSNKEPRVHQVTLPHNQVTSPLRLHTTALRMESTIQDQVTKSPTEASSTRVQDVLFGMLLGITGGVTLALWKSGLLGSLHPRRSRPKGDTTSVDEATHLLSIVSEVEARNNIHTTRSVASQQPDATFPVAGRNAAYSMLAISGEKSTVAHGPEEFENLKFMTNDNVRAIAQEVSTPCYVYDERTLLENAKKTLAFPSAYGLTVRFAMKACPTRAVIQIFNRMGLQIDASSGYEVERAIVAGVDPTKISLSCQQIPDAQTLKSFVEKGVKVNACSLEQLRLYGQTLGGAYPLGLRVNPGIGSGGTGKTNVGGPDSSFGIWHGLLDEAEAIIEEFGMTVERIHTHIGSGSDPAVWVKASDLSLALCARFPSVTTLNLGGGYKVARVKSEKNTDLQTVGAPVRERFEAFAKEHGREFKLEIEPGTFLVANAGSLISRIQDKVTTRTEKEGTLKSGHTFLKLDSGMTDILRPSLYAAQHPLVTVPNDKENDARYMETAEEYIVVGHCCESGDLLTPSPDDPEKLMARLLHRPEVNDLLVIEGTGAYVSSMNTKNYNSFPEAPEVLLKQNGEFVVIRHKQTLAQILQNEVEL